jgi:hypothetical protein
VPIGSVSQTEDILSLPKIYAKSNAKSKRKTRQYDTPPDEPITIPSEPSTSKSNQITAGEKEKVKKKKQKTKRRPIKIGTVAYVVSATQRTQAKGTVLNGFSALTD